MECHGNTSRASSRPGRVLKRSPAWAAGLFPSFDDALLSYDMALGFRLRLHALFTISLSISLTLAVTTPSTNTPVPPLQWIELTNLLSGSSPPGLKYASIGFDSGSSTLLIFGGESNGFPEQQTYL